MSDLVSMRPTPRSDPVQAEPGGGLNKSTWLLLFGAALISRIIAGFILPNAEEDGYSYAERIARLSALMTTGELRPGSLFDFWLPLFPFASAILNLLLHDPIVSGKIVNAICGAISCVFVFAITRDLIRNLGFACLAFGLILLNPFHILYSAACMTDVPHCCLVLASIWFVLRERWVAGAILAALAESVRIEAWALIPVIPFLQFVRERRVSILPLVILILPPALWFGIGFLATGDPLAYFADRSRYQASYLDFYNSRRGFVFDDVQRDVVYFLLGANPVIFASALTTAAIILWQIVRTFGRSQWKCAVPSVYGAALFCALAFAYVTKAQPVLLPRYSLVFFAIGLPLSAWLFQFLVERSRSRWTTTLILAAVSLACLWPVQAQVPTLCKVIGDFHAHERVTAALMADLEREGNSSRCFCDDVAIRVLSRQPLDRFLMSTLVPKESAMNAVGFESYLRQKHATHLVFVRKENSFPVTFYPALGRNEQAAAGVFKFVTMERSSFGPDIWLYRLRGKER